MSPRESSFMCARCGAGLDLEDTSPLRTAVRLGVVARGLKTYIVDDDTSFSTALATAERDVRHAVAPANRSATFANFCFGCRQYVCGRDWNQAVERCQTCVPLPEAPEDLVALDLVPGMETDGLPLQATNGDGPSLSEI